MSQQQSEQGPWISVKCDAPQLQQQMAFTHAMVLFPLPEVSVCFTHRADMCRISQDRGSEYLVKISTGLTSPVVELEEE